MPSELLTIAESIKDVRVLVIGDIMLDQFVHGDVERISPESPVPILVVQNEHAMLGGAGNVLSNLKGLGAECAVIAVIGGDVQGQQLQERLKDFAAEAACLVVDCTRPTTVKTRFLSGMQQLLRTDFEKKENISPEIENDLIKQFDRELENCGAVVISDYGKGILTDRVLKHVIQTARKKDIPVLVDPKGDDYKRYKGASIVTPNKKELIEASKMPAGDDQQVSEAAHNVMKLAGIDAVIATRSKDGMSVVQRHSKEAVHIPASPVEVFDVSGAGDTVIAVAAASLAAGADIVQAAQLANIAGNIVVTKVGTAPIRMDEMQDALVSLQGMTTQGMATDPMSTPTPDLKAHSLQQAPICNWDQAIEVMQRWRAKNYTVGFTNGCFDILHRGHAQYLGEARARCDRLIVALNSDASVKLLKGETRPVHDEMSRAAVLSSLSCVDMVVFFGASEQGQDNTPCELLSVLKPDLYFKGGDYTIDQLPEAKIMAAHGGEVSLLSFVDGYSTTGAIEKMKQEAA